MIAAALTFAIACFSLGLVLNLSVFHYEILKQHETGFNLAKEAYSESVAEIDSLEGEEQRESGLIVQLLEDNLKLWSEDQQ